MPNRKLAVITFSAYMQTCMHVTLIVPTACGISYVCIGLLFLCLFCLHRHCLLEWFASQTILLHISSCKSVDCASYVAAGIHRSTQWCACTTAIACCLRWYYTVIWVFPYPHRTTSLRIYHRSAQPCTFSNATAYCQRYSTMVFWVSAHPQKPLCCISCATVCWFVRAWKP